MHTCIHTLAHSLTLTFTHWYTTHAPTLHLSTRHPDTPHTRSHHTLAHSHTNTRTLTAHTHTRTLILAHRTLYAENADTKFEYFAEFCVKRVDSSFFL